MGANRNKNYHMLVILEYGSIIPSDINTLTIRKNLLYWMVV